METLTNDHSVLDPEYSWNSDTPYSLTQDEQWNEEQKYQPEDSGFGDDGNHHDDYDDNYDLSDHDTNDAHTVIRPSLTAEQIARMNDRAADDWEGRPVSNQAILNRINLAGAQHRLRVGVYKIPEYSQANERHLAFNC
jgi:hypothetical protein